MLSSALFKIHKHNEKYCLNDVVIQCEISKNPKNYYISISDKSIYNSQFYINKDKILAILSKAKAPKSKQLLNYLQDDNISKDK